MKRGITKQETLDLLAKIRKKIPNVFLRTTFIVGFPGETDEQFEELLDFVKETRFERMGTFVYSREEGTPAYDLPGQVPGRIKKERLKRLMQAQQDISNEVGQSFIGQTLPVIIDEIEPGQDGHPTQYIGRTQYDAPEVDGAVYVQSTQPLTTGDIVQVKIQDGTEYDLFGTCV